MYPKWQTFPFAQNYLSTEGASAAGHLRDHPWGRGRGQENTSTSAAAAFACGKARHGKTGASSPQNEAPSFPTALCAASRREEGKWRDALFPLPRGSDRAEAKAAAREAGRKHPFCYALQNFLDFLARRSPPPKKRTSQIIPLGQWNTKSPR